MPTISDRIREGLALRNMKQSELVQRTGIGKSSISTYISGAYEPKQKNIYEIAKALDVSEAWLMGYDVPMDREKPTPVSGSGPIDPRDKQFLELFSQLTPDQKELVLAQLKVLKERQ